MAGVLGVKTNLRHGSGRGWFDGLAKTAVKFGAELADDAANLIKSSTASAADALSSAQKASPASTRIHGPVPPVPSPSGASAPGEARK